MVFRLESLFTKAVRSERYNFYMAYIVQRKNSHPEKERRKKNRANNRKKKIPAANMLARADAYRVELSQSQSTHGRLACPAAEAEP
jgi:hypothetical protein